VCIDFILRFVNLIAGRELHGYSQNLCGFHFAICLVYWIPNFGQFNLIVYDGQGGYNQGIPLTIAPFMLKLLLITASAPEIYKIRRPEIKISNRLQCPLAALVPPHWEVIQVDDEVSQVDLELQVNLVGITFHNFDPVPAHTVRRQNPQPGLAQI
jgi:hypothetical protein